MPGRVTDPIRWLAAVAVCVTVALGAAAQESPPAGGDGASPAQAPDTQGGTPASEAPDGEAAPASDAVITRESPVVAGESAGAAGLVPLRTDSPRATMETFLRLASQMEARLDSYAKRKTDFTARRVAAIVTEFLEIVDLSEVPPASRRDVANDTLAFLMDIFGRIDPVDLASVPGADAFPDEGPASWRVPGTPLRIVRMTEGAKQGEFLFGPRTPVVAERFFPRIEHLPLRQETDLPVQSWTRTFPQWTGPMIPAGTVAAMPQALRDFALDTPIWKIIAIVIVTAALAAGIGLVHWLVAGPGGRSAFAILRRSVTPILMLAAVAWMGPFLQFQVYPSGTFAAATKVAMVIVWYAAWVWLAWLAVKALFAWMVRLRGLDEEGFNADLWRLGGTVLALLVSVIIIGDGATQLGLPVFSVLAGLGIGGLAVALAIRPTLENLIGGIILYTDQPVRVGDFCSFGDKNGTVEAIGVRSTKIRALDRTIITIPNAALADMQLVNYAHCDRMLIQTTLGLRYETTAEQLRFVLVKLREMLHAHPKIDADTVRVRFSGYGACSQDISIRIYALTGDWNEYFAIQEDALLRVKDIVEGAGTGFAFPSQTLYMTRDEGLDEERGAASEAEVRRWRKSGRLPFPRLARSRVEALSGTLDYPPKGSVEALGADEGWQDSAERLSAGPEDEEEETREKDPARA
jgi:MscS family membrane protein